MEIVLASTSSIRRRLLAAAALRFRADDPAVDEAKLKAAIGIVDPAVLATRLALAKAGSLTPSEDSIVIGADQVLTIQGRILTKPSDLAEARQQLLALRGKTHHLFSAVACINGKGERWSYTSEARLSVRSFSDAFLDWYITQTGTGILNAVGSYKIEEHGSHLFDSIEGDYFAILGLPLLPLLSQLRNWDAIPT